MHILQQDELSKEVQGLNNRGLYLYISTRMHMTYHMLAIQLEAASYHTFTSALLEDLCWELGS